jgi:hypothetical protein
MSPVPINCKIITSIIWQIISVAMDSAYAEKQARRLLRLGKYFYPPGGYVFWWAL